MTPSRSLPGVVALLIIALVGCPREEDPASATAGPCEVLVQVQGRAGSQIFGTAPGAGSLGDYRVGDGAVVPSLPNPCANAIAERLASSACPFCDRNEGQCEALLRSIFTAPPQICSPCGDGTCGEGETPANCPLDCVSEGTCGNNVCEGIETPESCPQDCDTACGDGLCIDRESPESCPQDCNYTAGDGLCAAGENPVNSPADCAGQTLGQPCESDADCLGAVCDAELRCNCDESQGGTCATTTCGDNYCQSYESSFRCPADCCGVDPDDEQRRPGPTVCTQEGTHCAGNRVVECRLAGAGNCPDLLSTQVCEFGCLDGQCLPCPVDLPGVVFCPGPSVLSCDGEHTMRQCEPFPGLDGCWYETTVDCVEVVGLDPAGMLPTICTAHGCSIGCPVEEPEGQTRCTRDGSATEVWSAHPLGSACPGFARETECGEFARCTQAGPQAQAVCEPIQAPNVASILPNAGVIGTEVRLIGAGLGSAVGTVVFSPNQRAFAAYWSDGQVNVRVPEGTLTGPVTLTTADGRVVHSPEPFTVEATEPVTVVLGTTEGRPGESLFLYGQQLGTTPGQVVFWTISTAVGNDETLALGVVAEVLAWDERIVQVRVPPVCGQNFRGEDVCGQFLSSTVVLRTAEDRRASTFQPYTVTAHATAVEVCGEARGEPYDLVTVRGYGFGTAQAPKVGGLRFGGVNAPLWVQDDEHLYTIMPPGAQSGAVDLLDERGWGFSGRDFEVLPLEREDVAGMLSYPMPDSPTPFCSDGTAAIDCAEAPLQDGARLSPPPDLNVVGEVVEDRVTGLVWQITPSATMSRLDAQCTCRALDLGGYNDWRLPWPLDLISLNDNGAATLPPLPPELAHGPELGLWTRLAGPSAASGPTASGPLLGVVRQGWQFSSASTGQALDTTTYATRCVRGGPPPRPNPRFVLEDAPLLADQSVTDQWTGLMWEVSVFNLGATWAEAMVRCDELARGGHEDWRVPTAKELLTLEDFDASREQAWPSEAVPTIALGDIWTSSADPSSKLPRYISRNAGQFLQVTPATSRLSVLCVRDAP